MTQLLRRLSRVLIVFFVAAILFTPLQASAQFVTIEKCDPNENAGSSFLSLPHWYEYIHTGTKASTQARCTPQLSENGTGGVALGDFWLIALAVVGILLRIAGLVAVGMVIFGGFKYITSQGNSDETKGARQTIINAFIGIVITIIAAVAVNFVATLLQTAPK